MERTRSRRAAATVLIALIVGVVGGWALSRSSDDVDANRTDDPNWAPPEGARNFLYFDGHVDNL